MGAVEVDAKQLIAAAKRLQAIERPLMDEARKAARAIEPQWKALLASNASTRLERRVIAATGSAVVLEDGLRLQAAKTGGTLRGGLSITKDFGAIEYGGRTGVKKTYTRKGRKRGSHKVTRNTTNQLRPHNADGYVFGPSVKAIVPKLAKAWFEGLRVVVNDSLEG